MKLNKFFLLTRVGIISDWNDSCLQIANNERDVPIFSLILNMRQKLNIKLESMKIKYCLLHENYYIVKVIYSFLKVQYIVCIMSVFNRIWITGNANSSVPFWERLTIDWDNENYRGKLCARLYIRNESNIYIVKSGRGLNGRWKIAYNGRWRMRVSVVFLSEWNCIYGHTRQKKRNTATGIVWWNTKDTIGGENFSEGEKERGREEVVCWGIRYRACAIETHRLAERIQVNGKRPGRSSMAILFLPLWSFLRSF